MRIVLLVLVLLLLGCGHDEKNVKEGEQLTAIQQKGWTIYNGIIDAIYIERCDKLTFKALLSSYIPQDISGHENNGRWERDVVSCYPEDSRSSISFEGILSVLHHILSTKDKAMLNRLIDYGNKNFWVVGDGPREYTDMKLLVPAILATKGKLSLSIPVVTEIQDILSGFRGHLLASYIWYSLRKDNSLGEAHVQALKQLVEASPEDPMYKALLFKVTGEGYDSIVDTLMNAPEFDLDGIYERDGIFNWGSSPAAAYYLYVLSILEGR